MGEYYCFLAQAIIAEEVEMYRAALVSGNFDTSKLKDPRDADRQSNNLTPILSKFGVMSVDQMKPMGSVERYATATGRKIVYYDPKSDTYQDQQGNIVKYDPDTMVRELITKKRSAQ